MRYDLIPILPVLRAEVSTKEGGSYKNCYSLHLTHVRLDVGSLAVKSQAKLVGQERTLGMRSWPVRTCMRRASAGAAAEYALRVSHEPQALGLFKAHPSEKADVFCHSAGSIPNALALVSVNGA